uniref:RING-type E3 ubiquitin transferase n=1 Tax=Kalanchoe fedtschenkoi TaxID=63787 RepID=A0A7N0R9H7_KALFE
MGKLFACIFIFITSLLRPSTCSTDDRCSTPSCNPDKEFFRIHFPFRLPQLQSNTRCGFDDNFTLSCGPNKETLLHLPNAGSFAIETIGYYDQTLFITDPGNCLPRRVFDGFSLSGSPFEISYSYHSQSSYTYYNCTSGSIRHYTDYVPCMSGDNYTVLLLPGGPQNVPNCTRIKTVLSAPEMSYGFRQNWMAQLNWYWPSCQACLSRLGVCGLKSHSNSVVCHSTKEHGLSDGAKYGLILGISIPVFFIIVILVHSWGRSSEVQQPPGQTQLVQSQAASHLVGLDGPTIESYPKFALGQNDALLEPSIGPCSICLCEYKPNDVLRTIPDCNHYFHSDCVDEWLKLNATCPVCRKMPDAS